MRRRRRSMTRNTPETRCWGRRNPVLWEKRSLHSGGRDHFGKAAVLEMSDQSPKKTTRARAFPLQPFARGSRAPIVSHCRLRKPARRHLARTSTWAPQRPAGGAMQLRALPPTCFTHSGTLCLHVRFLFALVTACW